MIVTSYPQLIFSGPHPHRFPRIVQEVDRRSRASASQPASSGHLDKRRIVTLHWLQVRRRVHCCADSSQSNFCQWHTFQKSPVAPDAVRQLCTKRMLAGLFVLGGNFPCARCDPSWLEELLANSLLVVGEEASVAARPIVEELRS